MAVSTDLCTVFDVFHDGWITELIEGQDRLIITVEIEYLAECIQAEYRRFTVELSAPYECRFADRDTKQTSDLARIAALELDILSADVVDKVVDVHCTYDILPITAQHGGTLRLSAAGLRILDQGRREWSLAELIELARRYWNQR